MPDSNSQPWYRAGLAFECRACGRCCSGPEEGYVWVTTADMADMARALGLTLDQFKQQYAYRVGQRYSLREHPPENDCILLEGRPGSKTCRLYSLRPRQCRTWPFWPENLQSPEAWRRAARRCPGIDQGFWHSPERIEAIRDGDGENAPDPVSIEEFLRRVIAELRDDTGCQEIMHQLYAAIDAQVAAAGAACDQCGRCCQFDKFDHRLYATTLEMVYFAHGLDKTKTPIRTLPDRCPYQKGQGCTLHPYRTAGCRIFYCRELPAEFQAELSEQVLATLREVHNELALPYYYADLRQWLAILAG